MTKKQQTAGKDREVAAYKTHEGFTITCESCGGNVVTVRSDVGYSPESGGWGAVYLQCCDCNARCDIWEML
jgi:hypothetical protein